MQRKSNIEGTLTYNMRAGGCSGVTSKKNIHTSVTATYKH